MIYIYMLCILYIHMYIILKYTHVYKYIHTYVYIYTRFFICPHMRSSPSAPWPVVALFITIISHRLPVGSTSIM